MKEALDFPSTVKFVPNFAVVLGEAAITLTLEAVELAHQREVAPHVGQESTACLRFNEG